MEKKLLNYTKPEIDVVNIYANNCILAGSFTGDDTTPTVGTGGSGNPDENDNSDDW